MRTLIYGFKPYHLFSENVTEQIVREFPYAADINKHVFEVEFNYEKFSSIFDKYSADLIIGMGQHPRARKLRIERKAVNRYQIDNNEFHMIRERGPESLYTNHKLPALEGITVTYDAGSYVCNFSMYLMCEHAIRNNVKFAFLHVPINFEKKFLISYLLKHIDYEKYNLNKIRKS
jgi:pyrrolidone-carboxylate peptidase